MVRHRAALTLGLLLMPAVGLSQAPAERGQFTAIYFVRHSDIDPTQPTFPLSEKGKLRAAELARTVNGVHFTHVFSSHTTRARQMVEAVAHGA